MEGFKLNQWEYKYLGQYESEREAAEAHNASVALRYGDFARLNKFSD